MEKYIELCNLIRIHNLCLSLYAPSFSGLIMYSAPPHKKGDTISLGGHNEKDPRFIQNLIKVPVKVEVKQNQLKMDQ